MKLCPQCNRKSLNSAITCECGYAFHDGSDTSQRQLQTNPPTEAQNARMPGLGEFKSCPFCKEQIRQEAVKCRFCGEWLEDGKHPVPDTTSKGSIPETPPIGAQQTVRPSDFHVGAIARDVAVLWVLTFIAGFLSSAAMRPVSVPLFSVVGFCISGYLAKENRWKHLSFVALFAWLIGSVNIFFGWPVDFWLFSVLFIFPLMGVGGGLSYLLKRQA